MNYVKFSDDVENASAPKGLEKTPTVTPTQFIPPPTLEVAAQARKTPEAKLMSVHHLLNQIAAVVRSRRMLVRPAFQDFDRSNRGSSK